MRLLQYIEEKAKWMRKNVPESFSQIKISDVFNEEQFDTLKVSFTQEPRELGLPNGSIDTLVGIDGFEDQIDVLTEEEVREKITGTVKNMHKEELIDRLHPAVKNDMQNVMDMIKKSVEFAKKGRK